MDPSLRASVTERKMDLIRDLEKPIGPDSPLAAALLEPRPCPRQPAEAPKPAAFKFPAKKTPEEQEELREAYWRHMASPVHQKFGGDGHEISNGVTIIIPGRAWVVSELLSKDECVEVIAAGESFGLLATTREAGTTGIRTNKRTGNYCNVELSALLGPRLHPTLLNLLEETKPHTAVRGIHPNWRIARYDTEDFFAAHYDQADSMTVQAEDGKERYDSSHTLLISLSDRSTFRGGATRFWPTGNYDDTAVDVELPCGYAVIFEQKLLHAGLAVQAGAKHIAQAGILRGMPKGLGHRPSTFRLGPGLSFV